MFPLLLAVFPCSQADSAAPAQAAFLLEHGVSAGLFCWDVVVLGGANLHVSLIANKHQGNTIAANRKYKTNRGIRPHAPPVGRE